MPSCEKCWSDANGDSVRYQELMKVRKYDHCTPEEQAGAAATMCDRCKRRTVHQYAKLCTICGSK